MSRLAILTALLVAFWFLLSGQTKGFLVSAGLVSVAICVWLAWRMRTADEEGLPIRLTLSAVTYWPWLAKEIYKSAISVTRIVLDPKLPISPTMVRVKASQSTAAGITTYANSITLTPGTTSVEVSAGDHEILVHALTGSTAADLEEGTMDRRVKAFEGSR